MGGTSALKRARKAVPTLKTDHVFQRSRLQTSDGMLIPLALLMKGLCFGPWETDVLCVRF